MPRTRQSIAPSLLADATMAAVTARAQEVGGSSSDRKRSRPRSSSAAATPSRSAASSAEVAPVETFEASRGTLGFRALRGSGIGVAGTTGFGAVVQGYLEGSNVDPIKEITQLIQAQPIQAQPYHTKPETSVQVKPGQTHVNYS